MSDAALFEEVLEGVACKFGAMVRAKSFQSSFALSLGIRKPLLKLRYNLIFGLEQQYPSVVGSIVSDGCKVLISMTTGLKWAADVNVHKF